MTKLLLTGNEAIARGAYEAGVSLVTGYPGTPSTEIIEQAASYDEICVEWAPNEKVALEVAIGASLAGARAMACMKHVGVNVAADPLLSGAYLGLRGGLVIVSADDPGAWSSQNEQDNRNYARFAKIPLLEPSDSAECLQFTRLAFEISEQFSTPVLVRTTTRISHTRTVVTTGTRHQPEQSRFSLDLKPEETVMVPAHARRRHVVVEERLHRLRAYAESTPINRIEEGRGDTGFITAGIAYQYVREAFPQAPVLKLGMSWPLPLELIRRFASCVSRLVVVEELDPFIDTELRAAGFRVTGKELLPRCGELSAQTLRSTLGGTVQQVPQPVQGLPPRPPVLCPGCPHRGVLYLLRRLKATVMGDIGCYTLGVNPPLSAIHSCTCMGAGIGHAHGMVQVLDPQLARRVVAVIGDSTFLHSGMTAVLNSTYNQAALKLVVLDNGTTAMTGHQGHPGSGLDAKGRPAPRVAIEEVVSALGVRQVVVVDPYDLDATREALEDMLECAEPAVVVARRPCVLLRGTERRPPVEVDHHRCTGCRACLRLGCPALGFRDDVAVVDEELCNGCGLCVQVCGSEAMKAGDAQC